MTVLPVDCALQRAISARAALEMVGLGLVDESAGTETFSHKFNGTRHGIHGNLRLRDGPFCHAIQDK
jgi:hypothetical protein